MPEAVAISEVMTAAAGGEGAPALTSPLPAALAAPALLRGMEAAQVTLSEAPMAALWQVTAWPEALAAAGTAAAASVGVGTAPGPGQALTAGLGAVLRTEPLRFWVVVEDGPVRSPEPGEAGTVLDLTQARWRVRLSGPGRVALMARLGPLDWRAQAFPVGRVASTEIGHVGVTVQAEPEAFALFLPRSFAEALAGLILETGQSLGIARGEGVAGRALAGDRLAPAHKP
ncbi:MAG: hypothetical protein AAF675_13205 [Pseudomonadota bacterium]